MGLTQAQLAKKFDAIAALAVDGDKLLGAAPYYLTLPYWSVWQNVLWVAALVVLYAGYIRLFVDFFRHKGERRAARIRTRPRPLTEYAERRAARVGFLI